MTSSCVSCLFFKCTFSCIVQYSLYHNIDRYNVTLYIGQQLPITICRTVFGCALFWCWVSLGAPVTISLIEFYFIMIFIMIVVTIIGIFMATNYFLNYTLDFLYLSSSGSANAQLPGCFRPWTFSLNIGLNMCTLWLLYVMFTFPTRICFTGEFQALQLIVLAAFSTVDWPLASCMLVHFLEI